MTSESIPRGASERPFSMTFPFLAKECFGIGTTLQWFGSEKLVQTSIFQVPKALKRRLKTTLFSSRLFKHIFHGICGKSGKRGSQNNE